jgi:hypothetical protein
MTAVNKDYSKYQNRSGYGKRIGIGIAVDEYPRTSQTNFSAAGDAVDTNRRYDQYSYFYSQSPGSFIAAA